MRDIVNVRIKSAIRFCCSYPCSRDRNRNLFALTVGVSTVADPIRIQIHTLYGTCGGHAAKRMKREGSLYQTVWKERKDEVIISSIKSFKDISGVDRAGVCLGPV